MAIARCAFSDVALNKLKVFVHLPMRSGSQKILHQLPSRAKILYDNSGFVGRKKIHLAQVRLAYGKADVNVDSVMVD